MPEQNSFILQSGHTSKLGDINKDTQQQSSEFYCEYCSVSAVSTDCIQITSKSIGPWFRDDRSQNKTFLKCEWLLIAGQYITVTITSWLLSQFQISWHILMLQWALATCRIGVHTVSSNTRSWQLEESCLSTLSCCHHYVPVLKTNPSAEETVYRNPKNTENTKKLKTSASY